MSNSTLVSYTQLSPNHSGTRTHAIDRITPHCYVGQVTVERMGEGFSKKSRNASSNYGIGLDARVGMYVEECNRSWCSSSNANDQRAVTIECASDSFEPYAFKDNVYNKLIDLCVDICERNGKNKLIWISDKTKSLAYNPKDNEMVLTVHRWFNNKKSCPGDWMFSRMDDLANKVTKRLSSSNTQVDTPVTDVPEENKTFEKGDIIRLKEGATYYNGKSIPEWVKKKTLYYRGKNNKGIIFSILKIGAITGVVKEEDVY